MHTPINSPWSIGSLQLPHRLIQGPLAGYSCAPFRELFYQFRPPAYCVTEMCSAVDVLKKHGTQSRYLYRGTREKTLAYQLSGNDKSVLADAALIVQNLGADLIDLNCGCPKTKIRQKGAGSALLEQPEQLITIIKAIRAQISIPLTVKIRIQGTDQDLNLAQQIEAAGADALIVHGRRWTDDYDIPCNWQQIAKIKKHCNIPIIANGDIFNFTDLNKALDLSGCDGFMIARAGCGRPWLYQELLEQRKIEKHLEEKINLFMYHLQGLATLEDEFKAVLQSRSLVRYYFREQWNQINPQAFYQLTSLAAIHHTLNQLA